DGDGGESLSTWIKRIRPSFEADRRLDRNPAQTAIGNPAARLADVLADGKIEIMSWHGQLFATDPELQQSRIDIDQRRPAEACQPVNLASQLPQAERVLQVHPEVPAAFGVIDDVEGCDDNGGHVAKRTNFECRRPNDEGRKNDEARRPKPGQRE